MLKFNSLFVTSLSLILKTNLLALAFSFTFLNRIFSQDTIKLTNNSFVFGKTIEVADEFIKVQKLGNTSISIINLKMVANIKYKNGYLEEYNKAEALPQDEIELITAKKIAGKITEVSETSLLVSVSDFQQTLSVSIDSVATITYANGYREKYNELTVKTIAGVNLNTCKIKEAKDKMYLKSGKILNGFVTEVAETTVVIAFEDTGTQLRLSEIKKDELAKIEYSNGYVENYNLKTESIKITDDLVVENKKEYESIQKLISNTTIDVKKSAVDKKVKPQKETASSKPEVVDATVPVFDFKEIAAKYEMSELIELPPVISINSAARNEEVAYLDLSSKYLIVAPENLRVFKNLLHLNLSNNLIKSFPQQVLELKKLSLLNLNNCELFNLEIGNSVNDNALIYLTAKDNKLSSVDGNVFTFPAIKTVNLSKNEIRKISSKKATLQKITVDIDSINLSENRLREVPEAVGKVKYLKSLNISSNNIKSLDTDTSNFVRIENIDASNNPINIIPNDFYSLVSLKNLYLNKTSIETISDSIAKLKKLQSIVLPETLKKYPNGLGEIISLRRLYLQGNSNIQSFPVSILKNERLEVIALDNTKIGIIPEEIGKLKRLKILSFSNCNIKTIPEALFQLPRLQQINLSGNKITEIPPNLGSLTQLEVIDLENSPVNGQSLLNLRKALPYAFIKYLSPELGMNFESKPIPKAFQAEFDKLLYGFTNGDISSCYQLGSFFEKNGDFGYAFKMYYTIAFELTTEGTAQHALTYYKIAELYDDVENKLAYNSIFKRRSYSDYEDFSSNNINNRALSLYCKLCDETLKEEKALPWIKKACAKSSQVYNETADNMKKVYENNSKEIERLIGSAATMADVSSAGDYLTNTATSNTGATIGSIVSIFGKVSKTVKESKTDKIKAENESLKTTIKSLIDKANYYVNLK